MNTDKIAIIGLGYVGLPLAVEFAKKYHTTGFDIKTDRINNLKNCIDETLEISKNDLSSVILKDLDSGSDKITGLCLTSNVNDLMSCNIYIITVPTPIDKNNRPDLTPLHRASELVGSVLKKDDIVIYESTVYPGVTEEVCVPILENKSNLIFNKDFYCGYSPERINPGDKEHTVSKILKITSGSTAESAEKINNLYKSIIIAGTHLASSIKVAEAAKVIENAQRDINIAFINELSKIFNLIGISTHEVLAAAGTKWNFLKFTPGLVGGHCIGVDPYYLAQKAQELGYHPEIILAGRRVNDGMGKYVASQIIKLMVKKSINIKSANILMLGITFKENCPDVRNTKIVDILNELEEYSLNITIFDPWADPIEVKKEYNKISVRELSNNKKFDAVILGVAHSDFKNINFNQILSSNSVIYDIKGFLTDMKVDGSL
jgi:UDP-N-acetyl-D-galactosamine dehydrogenase